MRGIAAVPILMIVTACQAPPPPQMTEAEREQIEAEVMEFAQGWMDIWEENDCVAANVFLHPDSLSFLYGGDALDRSEWLEACHSAIQARESFNGSWLETKVHVLTPAAAVFVGSYESTLSYTDGRGTRHYPRSTQMGLVERTASGWVFTTFSSNSGPYEVVEGG